MKMKEIEKGERKKRKRKIVEKGIAVALVLTKRYSYISSNASRCKSATTKIPTTKPIGYT